MRFLWDAHGESAEGLNVPEIGKALDELREKLSAALSPTEPRKD